MRQSIVLSILISTLLISSVGTNAFATDGQDLPNFYAGPIASTNGDWILSGHWMGYINQSSPKDSGFHSMFHMVMVNGSAPYIHTIGNMSANSITKEGNNTIMEGNVSITMKDGPVSSVPTTFTISNNNTITILPDSSKANNHFGNTTINGLVNSYNGTAKMTQMMTDDPEAQAKWNPLMNMAMMKNMLKDAMAKGNVLTKMTDMGQYDFELSLESFAFFS